MLRSYFIYPFTESVVVSIFLSIDKKISVAILEINYCILAYLTKMSWEKISVQGSTCVGKRLLDLASYEGGLPSNWGLPWRKLSTFDSHAPNPNKP